MQRKMPIITESAAELVRRMQDEPDGKKRQRLHAFYLVASGHARHRKQVAATLRVHRHSVAAWFAAYTVGGLGAGPRYHVPQPTRSRRITDTALTALKAQLADSHRLSQLWAHPHLVSRAVSGAVVVFQRLRVGPPVSFGPRPKCPWPSHEKKSGGRKRVSRRPYQGCSPRHSLAMRPGIPGQSLCSR